MDVTADGLTEQMKQDWDGRAREDAKWFINCNKLGQSEEEFDATGDEHARGFVGADLGILIENRDPRSLRILEIGCGIGRMTKHLAKMFGEVCATDVSGEMIRMASERLRDVSNIRLLETNGWDFRQIEDEYFDLIFSVYVFQHVASKEIIFSNIRDGYRVLRQGCRFKFLVNGITNTEFLAMEKDTWAGTSVLEDEIRTLSTGLGAQLVSLTGVGTQYCWVILRKPRVTREAAGERPRAQILKIGRAEDLSANEVEGNGKGIGIVVADLDPERCDANNVMVEFDDQLSRPFYVGPAVNWPPGLLRVSCPVADGALGRQGVRLILPDGTRTERAFVTIVAGLPEVPKIELITSEPQGSIEVFASGPASRIRVHTSQLGKDPSPENVSVIVDGRRLQPESVRFVPGNGIWLVTVAFPPGTRPGGTEVSVRYLDRESAPVRLHIKEV